MSSSFVENLDDDEIEQLLAKAQEESLRFYHEIELPRQQLENEKQNEIQKPEETILSSQFGGKSLLYDGVEAKGFHLSAGSTYIYPTNYPVRQYQASIVKTALFKNTLVSLPTGLGKTFIAAVIMYNFYRWYPHGKVVFMAPTRPLVAQQTKACHHIMNIPQDDTTEMTGAQSAEQRAVLWKEKRVFYLTPQVMVNDLKVKACPASLIKCVVIDEAHRATKDYAYCQVLKILSETDAVFRILGLSATPGNDVNAVQQVIQNLHISALEMRSEESMDVVPYVHSRDIDTVVVELSDNIQRVKEDLLQVYEKYAKKLKDFKALSFNIAAMSRFQVLKACEKFRAHPPRGLSPAMIGNLYSDFSVCMSLAHALELLQIYGLRAFYTYLSDENGEKNKGAATRLKNDEHLKEMLSRLQSCLYTLPNDNKRYTWGHPKLQKLVAALSEHFQKAEKNKEPTKAIIFCQYRVVVAEIVDLLVKLKPLIKAAEFIGQSGGKEKGMPQAKQLQIMKDFRNGLINCLVATCVAEEGLDVGEVDLIILMEAHKSPVRFVQRIGRTGRKRKGHCIVLLTKGKEEQKFHNAMATRKSYVQNIVNAPAVKASLYQDSPRMIPSECNPVQQLVHIQASTFESPARPGGKKQADIRKCFTAQAPAQSSDSSEADLLKAMEELGDLKLAFNSIPERRELWPRRHDQKIPIEELLSKDVNILSEWNEWNHEEQPSYFVSHTSQSKLLCHLLKVANKEIEFPFYDNISDNNLNANIEGESNVIVKESSGKIKKEVKKGKVDTKRMDIRACLAAAAEKNKSPEKHVIEILSDASEDAFPDLRSEPEPKRIKVSEPDELEIPTTNDLIISAFEENNNICSFLGKYMVPKTIFKQQFSFNLPNVETLLNNVSLEIILNLNVKKLLSIGEAVQEHNKSPIRSVIGSPLSSTFFEIDDLFDDENSCQDKKEISHSSLEICQFSQKVTESNYVPSKNSLLNAENGKKPFETADFIICPELPQNKDNELSVNSGTSSIQTVLNGQINPDLELSFNDSDEEYFNIDNNLKAEEIKSQVVFTEKFGVNTTIEEPILSPGENKLNIPLRSCSPLASSPKETCRTNSSNISLVSEEQLKIEALHSLSTPQKSGAIENEKSFSNDKIVGFDAKTQVAQISGIACSTPIASVKKFKKNIIKIESTAPLFTEKENDVQKSPSSEGSDMWNLSDLFEDEEDKPAPDQNSTMLGITQMVSLIEKEKIQKCNLPEESTVNQATSVPNKSEKTSNFSAFLDSDVDIFSEVNDNFHNVTTMNENITKFHTEVFSQGHKIDNKEQFIQKDDVFCSPFPVEKGIPRNNMKTIESINSFESNNDVCKNIISAKSHSLGFFDSSEPQKSQPIQQSQSVNFKKFSSKKILFSQKLDSQYVTHKKEDVIFPNSTIPKDSTYPNSQNLTSKTEKPVFKESVETTTKSSLRVDTYKNEVVDRIPQIISDDSDEDVFLVHSGKRKTCSEKQNVPVFLKPKDETSSSANKEKSFEDKRPSKTKRNLKAHNGLIEVEADVSGFDSSDDSDGSSLDDLDNSFINDDSECITNCTQTIYLKSVKSPVGQGKFKIPNNINYEDNVFSQQVPEYSEYINDSFCVDSEEETDEDNDKSLSILEIAERRLQKKAKGKIEKRKRRRIRSLSSTSPSPEKPLKKNVSMSQPSPKAAMNRKKRRICSDSEGEVSPNKDDSFKKKKKENLEKLNPSSSKLNYTEHSLPVSKLDKSLQKLTKKFTNDLDKIKQKYFGSDGSSDE